MRTQRPNMWQMSRSFLPQQISSATRSAPAMAIPGMAYMAYKKGRRNPLTRSAARMFEARPGSRAHMKGVKYLSNPDKVNPRKALSYLKGKGYGPYEQYGRQLTLSHPGTREWRSIAPLAWGKGQSGRGRNVGPGGMALPYPVWGQALSQGVNEYLGSMRGSPHFQGKSMQMAGRRQFQDLRSMIGQYLSGAKGVKGSRILKQFMGQLGLT